MEDERLALCQECPLAGHGQVVAAGLFLNMSEQEKKLCSAHSECMQCPWRSFSLYSLHQHRLSCLLYTVRVPSKPHSD
jgi:hypothetical protein